MVGLKYAEDSAEVEVLEAQSKRLAEVTKRIKASLVRIQDNGKSLEAAVGPAYNDTQQLQVVNRSERTASNLEIPTEPGPVDVDNLMGALDLTRAPLESKADV